MQKKKKKVLEYSFHIQIQGVQLHETQPRPAIVAASSGQASSHLGSPRLRQAHTRSWHPNPAHGQGRRGADLHSQNPVSGPSPGSPAETALQLPLPPDSQARPCQCSARAWPTRAGRGGPRSTPEWGVAVGGVDKGQGPLSSSRLREPHSQSCAPC